MRSTKKSNAKESEPSPDFVNLAKRKGLTSPSDIKFQLLWDQLMRLSKYLVKQTEQTKFTDEISEFDFKTAEEEQKRIDGSWLKYGLKRN